MGVCWHVSTRSVLLALSHGLRHRTCILLLYTVSFLICLFFFYHFFLLLEDTYYTYEYRYEYICIHIYIYIHTYIHVYEYVYIYIYVYIISCVHGAFHLATSMRAICIYIYTITY